MSEGFMDRWSRRKAEARAGRALDESAPPVAAPDPAEPEPLASAAVEPQPPTPTLDDVQALTPDADFKPFLARGVAPEVRNAALRKLFADPRFNLMDGLDVYIDDYTQPDPLPPSLLRQMASARFLQLVEEQPPEAAAPASEGPGDVADDPPRSTVAQSTHGDRVPPDATHRCAEAVSPHHADPDLQLQPDHAARRPGPGPGAA
ncbi:DUF3306 domain-containing protein [Ramlibacter sp. 2FC]|uniref:DUF3306 domain-containing protein n=1 Tax=Ramlibacter sp. 2FC TaxID=2502188 RepID=UPI0010F99275|nr:DUF3306 domain-containing protein [Ramlibacter sp. 2FC]